MLKNCSKFLIIVTLFVSSGMQAQDYIASIKNYLNVNRSTSNAQTGDLQNFKILNEVSTSHNGVTHVYATQQVNGIPIKNAIVNAAFKNGSIIYLSETLETNITSRATISTPTLNPMQAASNAAISLGLESPNFEVQSAISSQEFILNTGGVSLENVPVRLVYMPLEDGSLKLAWDLSIHTLEGKNWWSVRIDAITGSIIDQNDWILNCTFEAHNHNKKIPSQIEEKRNTFQLLKSENTPVEVLAGEQYNVYALPLESPNHGDRSLVTDPQNADASPFGWHDINGADGAEFTITRGNNVYAQEDTNGSNTFGEAPDGGEELSFDYPVDLTIDAEGSRDAAITNLFYWNNIIHDVFYKYGFDEAAGNFQELNYTGEGTGGDFVIADAQDNVRRSINNANFSTPPDGSNGVMQMFLWNTTGEFGILEVTEPTSLARSIDLSVSAFSLSNGQPNSSFFASLENPDADAILVLVEDDNSSAESDDDLDGCDIITNPEELEGNIALIRRGSCNFTVKVASAQAAGAIGVIIANNVEDDIINLGGEEDDQSVIPAGMINQEDGDALITALQAGEVIIVNATRPRAIDGSFDNGIVAHEYGHGISNRLTGGPTQVGCLNTNQQQEQMGEGWSDYFGLMLTMTAEDTAEEGRGIGTFATNQPIDGPGIRPAQYSTDFSINDLTYGDTNDTANISQPHGIGTVWASALWDMTWAFIDQYGFDADLYNGTGGNNIALQIVVDGLKLQPCFPGFVDGRDALLAAVDQNPIFTTDQERRDAKCLVYTAFANRGVGFSASQGSRFNRTDQVEAFDFPEGNDNFCNVLSVQDKEIKNFRVFPNPSKGQININIGTSRGEGSVKVFDINGREVYNAQKTLEGTVSIEVQGLATGVYLLQIQNDTILQTTKIVIE